MTATLPTRWWEWMILVFGAYRLTRLVGWDDWPPIVRARVWLLREYWVAVDDGGTVVSMGGPGPHPSGSQFETEKPVPGKPPSSEVSDVRPGYGRPTLAHLIHCPFCLGWWISLTVYTFWLADAHWALYTLFPWALSGLVGLLAKNLDP